MRTATALISLAVMGFLAIGRAPAAPGQGMEAERKLELAGKLLDADRKPFRGAAPLAFLHGATSPFTARTMVDPGGGFKFKGLKPGFYTLAIAVPRVGEMRQTVDVSPARADRKGRVAVEIVWDEETADRLPTKVAASQLSIPPRALEEFEKAEARLGRRDVAGAEAALKKAVEISPRFSHAWNQLGVICYQTQRFAEAEANFREALAQDPDSYPPLVNLGGALLGLQRDEESLEVNLRAVHARPDDALAHSQLGSSYAALGQLDKAEEALRRAIALEPGHFSLPHLRLARVCERKGNYAEAIRQLEELLRLHPDAPQAVEIPGAIRLLRSRLQPAP